MATVFMSLRHLAQLVEVGLLFVFVLKCTLRSRYIIVLPVTIG